MNIPRPPHIINNDSVTVLWEGKSITLTNKQPNFKRVRKALLKEQYHKLHDALSTASTFEQLSEGNVTIKENKVFYKGNEVNNTAAEKLLEMLQSGATDLKPWMRFIDKLMDNPSYNSREQLYKFLEHKNMPITEQGDVIGYKGVANDYKDIYTGKFDNSPGAVLEMPREQVDDSINHGCSAGFHIGSHAYADSWGSEGKLMKVEFNPKDAVSVPHCSNYAKLRVCRYRVVEEIFDRKPLTSGLDRDATDTKHIIKYLNKKGRKNKPVTLQKLSKKFPDFTMQGLIDAVQQDDKPYVLVQFDEDKNDYIVSLTSFAPNN